MLRLCISLSFLESLLYGAIISATDPVTTLAVMNGLGANEDLYALVFGESVLNDAVAITLYRTIAIFLDQPVTFTAVMSGLSVFMWTFLGSTAVGASSIAWAPVPLVQLGEPWLTFPLYVCRMCVAGVAVGLCISLIVKSSVFRVSDESPLESILVILFAFSSYLLAGEMEWPCVVLGHRPCMATKCLR